MNRKVGVIQRTIFAAGAFLFLAFLAPLSQAAGSDFTDRIIVKFRDPATHTAAPSPELTDSAGVSAGVALTYSHPLAGGAHVLKIPQSSSLTEVRAMTARLNADPNVEYAEPDQLMQIVLIPNDTQYANQWHYKEFTTEIGGANLPAAWDITTGAASVVTAVIDTGLVAHADIDGNILDGTGRVVPGYDFISTDGGACPGLACVANDGDGRDSNPSDPGDWITSAESASGFFTGCSVGNSSWHGTHVSGTVGALSNNGLGVAGVNWNSRILPVRVLGKCGGFLSDIADGMRWAAGLSVPGVPANANPAKVLNLSLGGSGACSSTYQNAINAITAVGSVVVVAAGNSNANAVNFQPANCTGVITVAATIRNGGRASYSNFGSVVEIAAPGGGGGNGVLSTLNTGTTGPVASPTGDTYVYYQGTSMAAPHVAGIASLLFSANASLTPAQVLSALQSTARAFPTGTGNDCTTSICGAGIVNAAAAVQSVAAPNNPPNTPASPSPANAATGVSITPTLSWTGGDPDAGQTVTYDIYFGTSASPPLAVSNNATTSYAPGTLLASTLYYWRIVARDNLGATTNGPTWSFTTGVVTYSVSGRVTTGGGQGGGVGLSGVTINLTGAATASTTTDGIGNYTVTGLANGGYTVTPTRTGYTFTPVNRSVTISGANVTGRNFTAAVGTPTNNPPNTPASPSPASGATGVSTTPTLSWTGGDPDAGQTVTYDIYFGTGASPPLVVSNHATTSYAPGTLIAGTLYYWRIVARDNLGATTSGPTWSFTTTAAANNPPNIPASPSPANAATGVSITPTLSWTGGDPDAGQTVTYDIYFGTAATPPLAVSNNATTNYAPGTLAASTLYYWRIVARDNLGATTSGPTWSFTTAAAGGGAFSVSGRVTTSGGNGTVGLSGVTITVSGAASAATTTNGIGNYTVTGLANGGYTVTPSRTGYTFTPVNRSVTISGANVTGQNFSAVVAP